MMYGCKNDPAEIAVTSVSINVPSITLTEGESQMLRATVLPSNASHPELTWSTSDAMVATVNEGTVLAVSPGTATITAAAGGKQASCAVTVAAKVISVSDVTLDQSTKKLTEGESFTLTATVSPADATDKSVSWGSSDTAVATVDQSGQVTAVKAGTATITVTTTDGAKQATCVVTVEAKPKTVAPSVKMMGGEMPEMNVKRSSFALINCGNEIIAAGGHVDGFEPTAGAEYYKNGWHSLPAMGSTHDNSGVAVMPSGKVMIAGGLSGSGGFGHHNKADIYDPATHSFTTLSMAANHALCSAYAMDNGDVIVAGNWYDTDYLDYYSASTSSFSSVKEFSHARNYPYILQSSADNAVIFGDCDNYGGRGTIYVSRLNGDDFQPELFSTWRPIAIGTNNIASCAIGEGSGDYRYLIPLYKGSPGSPEEYAIGLVKGEEFSLLDTDSIIPTTDVKGRNIYFGEVIMADKSKKVAYLYGNNREKDPACYVLKIDYSAIDTGGEAKLTLYYTESNIPGLATGQCGLTLVPDGKDLFDLNGAWIMVAGGIYNSNYMNYNYVVIFGPF